MCRRVDDRSPRTPRKERDSSRVGPSGAACMVAGMTGEAPRFHRALGWGMAAALLVRVALAARAPIIEVDGAYWAGLAAALERGDFRHGFSTAWPPLYPASIAALVRAARVAGLAPDPAILEACARLGARGNAAARSPLRARAPVALAARGRGRGHARRVSSAPAPVQRRGAVGDDVHAPPPLGDGPPRRP